MARFVTQLDIIPAIYYTDVGVPLTSNNVLHIKSIKMKNHAKFTKTLPFLLLISALTILSFVGIQELLSYSENIKLNGIKHLKTDINFNGGTIDISTHQESFAELKSQYSKPNWKAEIKWDSLNQRLNIHQPAEKNTSVKNPDKNDWKVKIPNNLETDYNINIGGGAGNIDLSNSKVRYMEFNAGGGSFNLNLSNSNLSTLKANLGGGALDLDLSGKHDKDIKATVNLGAGSLKLVLPGSSGIRVKVGGLAIVSKGGLKKHGGYYVNGLYGKASNSIDVELTNGVGGVELEVR